MSQATIDDEPEDASQEQDDDHGTGDDERATEDDDRPPGDGTHVEAVDDGSGCTEIREHLSEKRRQAE